MACACLPPPVIDPPTSLKCITALGLFFLIKQVFIYTISTTYNKNRIYSSNPPTPQCVTSIVLVYEKYLHGLINFKH